MPKYPQAQIRLAGEDGNAFSILGRTMNALKSAGVPKDEVTAYHTEATSGDYGHLLRTTMEWVTCDSEPTKRYTKSLSSAMQAYWDEVEEEVEHAELIAWDECHKIYLAMDATQAEWFVEHGGYTIVRGSATEMFKTLQEWYKDSCPLKFIEAVVTNGEGTDWERLIPQGAEDEDICESCGNEGVYSDGICESCWETEEEDEGDEW